MSQVPSLRRPRGESLAQSPPRGDWRTGGGRTPTGPGCCSRSAGCLPGSGRAQKALRPPRGSSSGSAPPSAPMPLQPPAQEGGVRLPTTGNPGPFPARGLSPGDLLTRRSSCRKVRVKKSILMMLQRTHLRHLLSLLPSPAAALEGLDAGAAGRALAPPVEEAGIDAIAGLQILVDSVSQLDQPCKALWPRLQGSPAH